MNILERNEYVMMANERLGDVPQFAFPARYSLRWYAPGDVDTWVKVQQAAERYETIDRELFVREFGKDEDKLATRVGFMTNPWGDAVGTIAAWADADYNNVEYGRIHWVAIVPEEQGKSLAKPMLSAACQRLLALGYGRAYLVTSTARVPAINLYRQFGFEPVMRDDKEREIWREMGAHLKLA
jgi:RimJ/RimL family protein N-acetyltransferase